MLNLFTRAALLTFFFLSGYTVYAQNNFWSDAPDLKLAQSQNQRKLLPKNFRSLTLDTARLVSFLRSAPKEFTEAARNSPVVLMLPMPDGSFSRFSIVETAIMEPGLAAAFPDIRTFGGQGIDDPYATIKIDWSPQGFHAMVRSAVNGAVLIDPYTPGTPTKYIAYHKKDFTPSRPFMEEGKPVSAAEFNQNRRGERPTAGVCTGGTLRRYRLAVACTGEYARAVGFGSSVTALQALSAIITTVNRVNGIYETEVDVRLVLISGNASIVFTNPSTDPFTGNRDPEKLIEESQQVITTRIGSANFDIGHTFSTGGGGYAEVGAVCRNNEKAKGVTGIDPPVGDAYDVDYVAHEIGHQFGGNHTFNATTGDCGSGNGNSSTNVEPGSGSTIMAYAGICEAENDLQRNTDPYFHAISFDEITNYINIGEGNSCAVQIATGNNPPVVNAGNDYFIPKLTPFVLTGSASDANGDALTYSWEQINAGGPFGNWNNPFEDAPIFRSFQPVPQPTRYFPKLGDVRKDMTTIGEILPSYSRILNFRLTARDNRAGGGGVCFDETSLTVNGNAGPFVVTSPNITTTWNVGTFETITWDVANTDAAPINCANVTIELSLDSGLTFPIQIRANTPNDGSEEIIVPNNITKAARIRVRSVGNVFYDMSNLDFEIQASPQSEFIFNNPADVYSCNVNTRGTVINTSSLNNFLTPITLSASGNPAGTTVNFSSNPINPGTNVSITLLGTTAPGAYDITITGTAGQIVKTRVIKFVIGAPAQSPQSFPADSIGYSLLPTFSWQPTPGAVSYKLEVSKNSSFSTIDQAIPNITGNSYTLDIPLLHDTEYFWRVFAENTCGTGPSSRAFLFKTLKITCSDTVFATDVPVSIADNAVSASSTLNIASGGVIADVDVVGLKGERNFIGNFTVRLQSPANTSVELFSHQCESEQNFDINFDDDAPAGEFPCPPAGGLTVRPSQPLAAFNDENSTGTWSLELSDNSEGQSGSLTNWGLRICTYSTSTLPVNWLTFAGKRNDNNTTSLQWSTANEIDNKYYEIERAIDGINFVSIGKISAGSNPGTIQQYVYNDVNPLEGANFYRLKQVDNDGRHTYSAVVKVVTEKKGMQYVVYPNPAVDRSKVRFLSSMKQVVIRLNDASGKVIYQKSVGSVTAGQEFAIPVKRLSKGLYVLILLTEQGMLTNKLIVQ